MKMPGFRFLPNEAGEKECLDDAVIETFFETLYASCAREAGRNSRDDRQRLHDRITLQYPTVPAL